MASTLNSVSDLAYRLRQSRIAGIGFVLAMLVCLGLIMLARTEDWEDTQIYALTGESSLISMGDRYVSVSGTLRPDQVYTTQASIGGITLSGGRYIPLLIDGAQGPIFVADGNIPPANAEGRVNIVGKLHLGEGAQPAFYIEMGNPPNLALQNVLARVGIFAALALLALWFIVWWIGRRDYALGVAGAAQPVSAGQGALWFGSLGAAYGNAVVRHVPVTLSKARDEIALDSPASRPPWRVSIREIRRIRPASIATAYGPLPGARVEFQDERGLLRRGAIAACDPVTHEHIRSLFGNTSLK
jgi:hypothetical protein